ncbi:MAG TPA: gliding motility-associated ABC transporter ATP-binding subunit GldA [Cytophagales bacterium]|nr:gliding motility-associated ABC transporter ATP-binding subunit GldA [Cytophagales bacterium]
MSIVIKNLVKQYGSQKAVNNISFEAKKGEILGFLGPNGAGKSTTMKITTGYLPPTEGTVEVCGMDVTEKPVETKKNIGYLPEHNPLYLDMFVHEYLQFVGALYGLKGNYLKDRVKEMVEICGLGLEQKKKIGALSKGYRQRVGLAQALIHNPPVLILDEPTSGLDPNQILEIRKLIKSVSQDKTIVFSTHIMQEVQALCDRVIIINSGNIVANSTIAELKSNRETFAVIHAEFSGTIDIDQLRNLEGVNEVIEAGIGKYKIRANTESEVRPKIFKLASELNWPLIGLNQEEHSLENIFQSLTKKDRN